METTKEGKIEYNGKEYSSEEFLEGITNGEISGATVNKDTMDQFLTSTWENTLSEAGWTPKEGSEYQSAQELISAALSGQADAITELSAALENTEEGLSAFGQAALEAAQSAERMAEAQKGAAKFEDEVGQKSRIANVVSSYAASNKTQDWQTYAATQGLTETEIAQAAGASIRQFYDDAA